MHARQSVTLIVSWSGGRDLDVVVVRHNGQRVPPDDLRIEASGEQLSIAYTTPTASHHQVAATFSFIGETRRDLQLLCLVDGEPAGGAIHVPRAEHRWEARATWSVAPPPPSDTQPVEVASLRRPSPRTVSTHRIRLVPAPSSSSTPKQSS